MVSQEYCLTVLLASKSVRNSKLVRNSITVILVHINLHVASYK